MSNKETVKLDEDVKERLDTLRGDFKYAEPSYSGLVEYLLDSHDGTVEGGEELPDGTTSDVTRRSAGGDDESEEDDSFQTGGLTAEERADQFRVE